MIYLIFKLCERTASPQWSESFYFLIKDPKHDMLVVKVSLFTVVYIHIQLHLYMLSTFITSLLQLSSGWDQPMGSVVVPVRGLLSAPQLVLDEWLPLDGASPKSQVLLRAELKVEDLSTLTIVV